MFLKAYIGHYSNGLGGFPLGLPNLKMTLITLNTNFHINLGRFVGD
jgi:hypothetical protein